LFEFSNGFIGDDALWVKAITVGSVASIAIVLVRGLEEEAVFVSVIKLSDDEASVKSVFGFSRLRI
jgi:hypothetical protein